MRGVQQFEIPTPTQGLLKDRPTQQVGLDGLLAGTNMMIDADGYYRPRGGYQQWLSNNPTEPLYGLAWYTDTDGTSQYVGAGLLNVWADIGGQWKSMGGHLHTSKSDLVSIVPFLQPWIDGTTQTVLSAIIANNRDQLVIWNQNLNPALALTTTHLAGSGNALAFNTVPNFSNSYPAGPPGPNWYFTVTATNTNNVTLSINGISAAPVLYVAPTGALSQLPASYLIPNKVYNVAFDGTEFVIGTNVLAPIARAICALNNRIVAINVQTPGGPRIPGQVTWSSAYDATSWPFNAFQNLVDTDDPLIGIVKIGFGAAVVYGEESGYLMQGVAGAGDAGAFSFVPINGYVVGPVSPLAITPYSGGHLFLARDGRVWTVDGINATPYSASVSSVLQSTIDSNTQSSIFSLADTTPRRIWWFYQQKGQGISSGLVLSLDPQPHFESIQTFPQTLFTAATTAVSNVGLLWSQLTRPWNTYTQPWSSFATVGAPQLLLSDIHFTVSQFGASTGALDNGTALVPYSYTPGLMTLGATQDLRPESFDFFMRPSSILELATAQFDGLAFPEDTGETILAAPIDFHDPLSFSMPQVFPEMTTYSRYLRLTISGNSYSRACAFGGARIYVNAQNRPSV